MKLQKDQEIVTSINIVKEILVLRASSVHELFLEKSKRNSRIKKIIELAKKKKINLSFKDKLFFEKNFQGQHHQYVAIVCKRRAIESEIYLDNIFKHKKQVLFLILDHMTDPQNVGACMRTAAAAGVDAVIVPKDRACHLTPTVRKISSGGSELIPFIIVTNIVRAINKIKNHGVKIVGGDHLAEQAYNTIDLKGSVAFIIGSEGNGLRRLTSKNCDNLVSIFMPGRIESLNASVSTGILLFEYVRQNFLK